MWADSSSNVYKQPVQHCQQGRAYLWKDTRCGVVRLDDDMLVELGGVHAQGGVEGVSLVVI